jgi:hypothetical protein
MTAMSLITALLVSIVSGSISQLNPRQNAFAQTLNSASAASNCQTLKIAGIIASGNDGHVPANVLDNNLNTRWSNLGIGSFIQADLGGQKTICSVDIAWYRGNLRVNNFVISVSNDGNTFTNVFAGKSSGTTLSPEKYQFAEVTAHFVRITVNGNTENNWASVTELSVDGSSAASGACAKLPVASLTASGTGDADDRNGPDHDSDDSNVPANVLDNNLNTRWSNLGIGSFIQADLGGQKTICSVDIAWYRGNLRVNNFVISVSNDGNAFTPVLTGKSSGTTLSPERYALPTNVTTHFVRVMVNGNTENEWATITELGVEGFGSTPQGNTPTADNKAIQTKMNTPVQITLTGTDPIPGDVLKFSLVSLPQNGKLVTGPASHTVTYTPNNGFTGTDSFTYKGTDGQRVDSNIAKVTITVNPVQPPPHPTADNKTMQTKMNTPVQITLTGTDPIPGDVLKFSVVANPSHGSLTNPTANTVTYTPNNGFTGTDSFTYKGTDGQGVDSNIAKVTITVNSVQPPPHPTADNKTMQTKLNTPVQITLTGTDPIPGDVLKFSVVANPSHGSLTNPTANTVTYTPNNGFTGTDSFTYKGTDGQRVDSNIAKVTIVIKSPPPPSPTVDSKTIQTNKATPVQITLTGTDPIPGDVLKFSVVGLPQHGTVTNGTVSSIKFYTPNTGFIGTDSFTYKATDGQGAGSNIATVTIIVSNATSGTLDPFGIREIYPTKLNGEQWFMNMNDPNHDNRTEPQTTLTKNPDGSWKVQSTKVRFNVFTSSGYHHELITTLNQTQLAAKGYMQSPNDWKNVEMTGYLKLNAQGGDTTGASGSLLGGHYTFYTRGGHHTGSGAPAGCEATSYHGTWDYPGTTRFEKEQWHVSYAFTPHKPATGSVIGKWVGFKTIMYNLQQNGKTVVKLEIWVDYNDTGNWVKVNDFVDAGGFGNAGAECGGAPDQIITWGGPIATYRWDNSPDVDVKDLSVREIQPPAQ